MPIEHSMPDPHVFNVVINERQRGLLRRALNCMIMSLRETQWLDADEEEMSKSLSDMLNPEGSTGPLEPAPAVNSFVL